jgi:hypothetical protein
MKKMPISKMARVITVEKDAHLTVVLSAVISQCIQCGKKVMKWK